MVYVKYFGCVQKCRHMISYDDRGLGKVTVGKRALDFQKSAVMIQHLKL